MTTYLRTVDRLLRAAPIWAGPVLMAAFLGLATWAGLGYQVQFSVAPAFVILAYAAYSGLVAGSSAAGLLTVYSLWLALVYGVPAGRTATVLVSAWAVVLVISTLQARASLIDTKSNLMAYLMKAMLAEDDNISQLKSLLEHWPNLSHETREQTLRAVILRAADNRHHLAHLTTLVFGWAAIRAEMDETARMAKEWSSSGQDTN